MSRFNFTERLKRTPYAFWSLGLLLGQYFLVNGPYALDDWSPLLGADAWIVQLQSELPASIIVMAGIGLTLAFFLLAAWALVALAFRRVADCDASPLIAPLAMVPILQIPVILFLCIAPSRTAPDRPRVVNNSSLKVWHFAAQGALAGIVITVGAVAISALVFGSYSIGMFIVSPLVIGVTTAYLANRKTDIGKGLTSRTALASVALGGVALLLTALEGIICIILAAPLAAGIAFVGAMAGRSLALLGKNSTGQNLSAVTLLPLVFARYSRKLVMAPEGRHIMAVLRRRQFSKRKGMPHVQI